jgi:hypothetical protein
MLAEKAGALDGRGAKYHRQLAEALGVRAQHAGPIQRLRGERQPGPQALRRQPSSSIPRRLQEPGSELRQLLESLVKDPNAGVGRVLGKEEIQRLGGCPGAEFLVEAKAGFTDGSQFSGPLITDSALRGIDGCLPDGPEMESAFFLEVPGIAARPIGWRDRYVRHRADRGRTVGNPPSTCGGSRGRGGSKSTEVGAWIVTQT